MTQLEPLALAICNDYHHGKGPRCDEPCGFCLKEAQAAITELGPHPIGDMPEELLDGPYEPGEARKPSRYVLLYGKGPDDIAVAFSYYNALSEREWITENGELSFTPTHYSEIIQEEG